MSIRRILILLVLAAVVGLSGGCNDDDDVPSIRPTMANIWPHADGSGWTYEMTYRFNTEGVAESDGELPTMEELRRDLMFPPEGEPDTVITALYTLSFDGMTTTNSGVEAQNLVETIENIDGSGSQSLPATALPRRLLRSIAMSRPELRDKIAAATDTFISVNTAWPPLFLGGGAFAYEDSGYYGYGDLYADHSWIYLEGSLRKGQEFSLQLARGFVHDIWLYGQIWDVRNQRIDGVLYRNVVECMYVIDLGEQAVTDETGEVLGAARSYIYGQIYYAPELGPIGTRERSRVIARTAYNPEGTDPLTYFMDDYECWLVESILPGD